MKLKDTCSLEKNYEKPRQCITKQRHRFADKSLYSQSYGFSCRHVWMWELDHKEGWAPKNWYFWTVVLEKALENHLDSKEIKPVNPEENIHWKDWYWSWSFSTLATWCEEPTNWKRPWCWERLRAGGEGEDRAWDGWHHRLKGHEFEQIQGDGEGQGSLACYSPWGCEELDTT